MVCPSCKDHSDLSLDWPAAPEDSVPLSKQLGGKVVKGCTIFHENSLVAWLWFKYHGKNTVPPPPVENNYPVDEPRG